MAQLNISINLTILNLSNVSNTSTNQSLSSSSFGINTLIRCLQIVYFAVLIILGVSGNIICAIVFCTKSLRRIRSSSYLLTLALTDAFFILDLLPGIVHTAFLSNLYRKIHLICYIQTYISFVASFAHIWMVLVFTAERFFAVNFPLKHMSQCTPNLSRIVILIIMVPPFICYIHPAFFVSEVDGDGQCREKGGYERYLNNLNMIDTILTMFLPFILVSILNILIIRKLFCSKVFRQHVFANGSRYQCQRTSDTKKKSDFSLVKHFSTTLPPLSNQSQPNSSLSRRSKRMLHLTNLAATHQRSCLYRTYDSCESLNTNLHNIHDDDNNNNNHHVSRSGQSTVIKLQSTSTIKHSPLSKRHDSAHRHVLTELRLTKMLLAISLTCLSLNFPSYYSRLIILYERTKQNSTQSAEKTNSTDADADFLFYSSLIFHCMSYLSYSINIFIYLLFGGNFRRALKHLFSFKSSHAENLATNIHRKTILDHVSHNGNVTDYDSTAMTSISLSDSLRDYKKSFKVRDQSHHIHEQPIYI